MKLNKTTMADGQKFDISLRNSCKMTTLLIRAMIKGASVHAIIKTGDYVGHTPFTFAAKRGDEDFAKYLIEKGVDLKTETIFGYCSADIEVIPDDLNCPTVGDLLSRKRQVRYD